MNSINDLFFKSFIEYLKTIILTSLALILASFLGSLKFDILHFLRFATLLNFPFFILRNTFSFLKMIRILNFIHFLHKIYLFFLILFFLSYYYIKDNVFSGEIDLSLISLNSIPDMFDLFTLENTLYLIGFISFSIFILLFLKKYYRKRQRIKKNFSFYFLINLLIFACLYFVYLKEKNHLKRHAGILYNMTKFYQSQYFDDKELEIAMSKYLGMDLKYESKENFSKLLLRKTSAKAKERNIIFFVVGQNIINKIYKQIKDKDNYYHFEKSIALFKDKDLNLKALKYDLPVKGCLKSYLPYIYKKKSFSLKPFKSYEKKFLKIDKLEGFSINYRKYAYIIDAQALGAQDILEFINNYQDVIYAITGNKSKFEKNDISKYKFLNRSTKIIFKLPKDIKPEYYNPFRIAGQEDIMSTLYDLALDKKSFLSLGDNLFIDSNSNAINEDIIADQTGAWINNQFFSWKNKKFDNYKEGSFLKERYEAAKVICRHIAITQIKED